MNDRKEKKGRMFTVVATGILVIISCLAFGGFALSIFRFPQFGGVDPRKDLVWQRYIGNTVMSAPVVKESIVYFGSLADRTSPEFYALDATTGDEIWVKSLNDWVELSPIATDKFVYFSTVDGYFYCLDKDTGQEQWVFTPEQREMTTEKECDLCDLKFSEPVIKDDVLYVGSRDNNLYAFDAETGKLQWYFPTQGRILEEPIIVGDQIYLGSLDGFIYVLDRNSGKEIRRLSVPGNSQLEATDNTGVYGIVLVENDTVYAINGKLLAIDVQTGQSKWEYGSLLPQNSIIENGAALDEIIIVATENGVIAVNKSSGEKEWEFSKVKGGIFWSPTLYAGFLYFGDSSGFLYILNAKNGHMEKRYNMSKLDTSSRYLFVSDFVFPPAVDSGMVYVSSYGYLFALRIED